MRWTLNLILVAALAAGLPGTAAAEADLPPTVGEAGQERTSVIISNPGAEAPGTAGGLRSGGRRRSTRVPEPGYTVTRYHFRGPLGGDECLYSTTYRREEPISLIEQTDNDSMLNYAATFDVPRCDEAATASTPAVVAESYVRAIPLPAPRPHIAPGGTNITGLPAFLETNGALVHTVGPEPTQLGPIAVEATAVYWVDWGDGTPEAGPFPFEGGPYPGGRISHVYQFTGNYTVTVRQAWTADWSLGADSGTVDDLRTEASIPLQVGELQAVIQR